MNANVISIFFRLLDFFNAVFFVLASVLNLHLQYSLDNYICIHQILIINQINLSYEQTKNAWQKKNSIFSAFA